MLKAARVDAAGRLQAASKGDSFQGKWLFTQCFGLILLLSVIGVLISAYEADSPNDFVLLLFDLPSSTDPHQAWMLLLKMTALLAVLGVSCYVIAYALLAGVSLWQRRHTLRLFNESTLLWTFLMSDQTGARDQPAELGVDPGTKTHPLPRRIENPPPATLADALLAFHRKYWWLCYRARRWPSPLLLLALPIVCAIGAAVGMISLSPELFNKSLPASNGIEMWTGTIEDMIRLLLHGWPFLIVLFSLVNPIEYGRKIGVRQALIQYFNLGRQAIPQLPTPVNTARAQPLTH